MRHRTRNRGRYYPQETKFACLDHVGIGPEVLSSRLRPFNWLVCKAGFQGTDENSKSRCKAAFDGSIVSFLVGARDIDEKL